MKLTNKAKIPEELLPALEPWEKHIEPKRYSVSAIIAPPTQVVLNRRHYDEIEVEACDRIWALFGTAVHKAVEGYDVEGLLQEEKMTTLYNGITISGIPDIYNPQTKTLTDLKVTSVWSIIYGSFEDWEQQLNLYKMMLEEKGYEVKEIRNLVIMRDWQKSKAKFDPNYPQYQVGSIYQRIWDREELETWLDGRLYELERRNEMPDEDLPPCTPDERWNSGTKYAVKKGKNKRALRVYDEKEVAEELAETDDEYWVEVREGEDKRCEDYCDVAEFCPYWKSKKGEQK